MDRLLSTLLVEMDGTASGNETVVVVAATNHMDMLDPAILRPGRLDLHLEMRLPDLAARGVILAHHLAALPLALEEGGLGIEGVTRVLAERTEGFSGADIRGLCQEAALLSLREDLGNNTVRLSHLLTALEQGD